MKPSFKELDNGLRVVVIPHKVKTITACLRILCGSNIENNNEIGAAHMLEHLSMKTASKTNYANKILYNGGRFTGTTSRDDVAFFTKILKQDLGNALEYLKYCMTSTGFSEQDLHKTIEEIIQEISINIQDPMKYIYRLSYKNIFPGQRPEEFNTGNIFHVKSLSLNSLIDFKKENYSPSNAVLSICGDLKPKDVFDRVKETFGNIKTSNDKRAVNLFPNGKSSLIEAKREGLSLTYFKIDHVGFKTSDPQKYSAFLLGLIMKARLKKILGAYTLDAFSFSSHSYGIFSIVAAVNNEQYAIIYDQIKKQQNNLIYNEINLHELNYAKNKLLADFEFSMEKTSLRADYFSELFLYDQVTRDYKKDIENYMKCTEKDLKEVAGMLFEQKQKLTILC